jgi:putative transposase
VDKDNSRPELKNENMINNPRNHRRCSIRLKAYNYAEPGWYYVTICTYNRKCLFGDIIKSKMILNKYGKIVEQEWLKTKEIRKNVDLDHYK